ncbi:MAG: 3-isopropylmalate dehydratase large subunit [Caldiserica bacterium]|nr:3-isopropylmalate dehydratase large subunit [Caldisericota bacterium]
MTLAEAIIARHAGRPVAAGEFVEVPVDFVLANDITAPLAIRAFRELGAKRVFDPVRVALVLDHFTPCKDVRSAEQCRVVREFARAQGIPHLFEEGRGGIEHVLLPERGLVLPGEIVVGGDSHTCTYGALGAFATGMGSTDIGYAMATGRTWLRVPRTIRVELVGTLPRWVTGKDLILHLLGMVGTSGANWCAFEFGGEVGALPLDDRLTVANMAVEAGATAGLFPPDEKVLAYLRGRAAREYEPVYPEPNADYAEVIEVDLGALRPLVARPHSPANVVPVDELGEVPVDQVVIGSCTNGRWRDLLLAAEVLRGREVHPGVRCIVIPGSQELHLRAVREGLAEAFLAAGAVLSTPTCGPCLGGHMGVLAAGERCVSTTNRNFRGRMGHPEGEVYLANPAVAAASAVLGRIASPEEL